MRAQQPALHAWAFRSFSTPACPRRFSGAVAAPSLQADAEEGVGFGDLLAYLGEKCDVAQQAVEDQLSELAKILGYGYATAETRIKYVDAKILMEEVGMLAPSETELRRFVEVRRSREPEEALHHEDGLAHEDNGVHTKKKHLHQQRRKNRRMKGGHMHVICRPEDRTDLTPEEAMLLAESHGGKEEEEQAMQRFSGLEEEEVEAEDVEEYFEVTNTKELIAMAKRRGDRVEAEHKFGAQVGVAARVTTELGTVIHFKPLGNWDKNMWEDWLSHLRPCKKIHIRASRDLVEEAH